MDYMNRFRRLTHEQKRMLLLPESVEELIYVARLCGIEMTRERAQKSYELCHSAKTVVA